MTQTVLKIDASARIEGSVTRDLTTQIVAALSATNVIHRDLARDALPHVNEGWVGANFTPAGDRSDAQKEALALSDALIAEVKAADTLVIGLPIYNFGVPAALKAWVDLVARAGVTFQYTEQGPKGLLEGKRAILAVASGGVAAESAVDFATPYMRHALAFLGIDDVSVIASDQLMMGGDEKIAAAREQIAALAA